MFANAHFTHPQGKDHKWTAADFLDSPEAAQARADAERDRLGLEAALMYEKQQTARMKAPDFDDSELPVWARMTPEEKRKRNIA
jgi:hypothetical protein